MHLELVPDIVTIIVDHLHDDKDSLLKCSLISRSWTRPSHSYLFRGVKLRLVSTVDQLVLAKSFFQDALHIKDFVRRLHIVAEGDPVEVELTQLYHLVNCLPHLQCLTLEGICPYTEPDTRSHDGQIFRVSSVRILILRNIVVKSHALFSFFTLSKLFPNVSELTMLNVDFEDAQGTPPTEAWNTDLPVYKIKARKLNKRFWAWLPPNCLKLLTTVDFDWSSSSPAWSKICPYTNSVDHLTMVVDVEGLVAEIGEQPEEDSEESQILGPHLRSLALIDDRRFLQHLLFLRPLTWVLMRSAVASVEQVIIVVVIHSAPWLMQLSLATFKDAPEDVFRRFPIVKILGIPETVPEAEMSLADAVPLPLKDQTYLRELEIFKDLGTRLQFE